MDLRKQLIVFVLCLLAIGAKADNVYHIWPVPQQQVRGDGWADLSAEATLIAGRGIDGYTIDRARQVLSEHGIKATVGKKARKGALTLYLGIHNSGDAADKLAAKLGLKRDLFGKQKYDRHILSVRAAGDAAQVVILGEHTDAVFCGLASLEQMLDESAATLACGDIYDWADIQYRGVIEGYYGVPYSAEVTADLFRFMARYKMNTYMYGAKSDPYHSQYWDKPYPTTLTAEQQRIGMMTEAQMRELAKVGAETKVNFIWAIHPGVAFTDPAQADVLDRIMDKFQKMHDLGVRQFGVFVDDVGVPYDEPSLKLDADRLTQLQQMVDKKWNYKGAPAADTVKALNYVPQLYAYSWTSKENAEKFFRSLSGTPKKTNIFITGAAVWTVPNSQDPALVSSWLGRDVAWWWNYPCNDNDMNKIFPLDMYRNFQDERWIDKASTMEPDLKGVNTLISNPMQQGEVSKIALFSVGDYAWNRAAFDNDGSWMAALKAIFHGKAQDAFTLLPYLSYYDQDTPVADLIRQYKADPSDSVAGALQRELARVNKAAKSINEMEKSADASDRMLWLELHPYVEKVADMTSLASFLVKKLHCKNCAGHKEGDAPSKCDQSKAKAVEIVAGLDKEEQYTFDMLTGMGTDIKLTKSHAEPSARVLRPFLNQLAELNKASLRK